MENKSLTWTELAIFLKTNNVDLKVKLNKIGFEAQVYRGARVAYATNADLQTAITTAVLAFASR
jgi:hypothetical protein